MPPPRSPPRSAHAWCTSPGAATAQPCMPGCSPRAASWWPSSTGTGRSIRRYSNHWPAPGGRPVEGVGLGARHGSRGHRDGGAAAVTDPFALIVLAKAPVPGRVKTRLCPPATLDQAADLAAAALLDTLAAAAEVPSART